MKKSEIKQLIKEIVRNVLQTETSGFSPMKPSTSHFDKNIKELIIKLKSMGLRNIFSGQSKFTDIPTTMKLIRVGRPIRKFTSSIEIIKTKCFFSLRENS